MDKSAHIGTYIEEPGLMDSYRCSCGWESSPYFDGAEYARQEFELHKRVAEKEPK